MSESQENYDQLRNLLSPSIGVPLEKSETVNKLLHNMFTEDEAFIIVKGIKKAVRPVTQRRIRKRTNHSKSEIKAIIKDMNYKGKIIKIGPFIVVLPYLPGLFEFYFTTNRDDSEKIKKAGEAHYELLSSGFHVEHTQRGYPLYRVIPAVKPIEKSIEINKTIQLEYEILPHEILRKYLSKFKTFAIQPCSCRNAAKLAGHPCKQTDENFCVSAGFLAKNVINTKVGKKVSLDELMEIMNKAEKEGLVHETINIKNSSVFICNCCSCCCGFLKSVKELNNKKAIAEPNFEPLINHEACKLCETCIEICPMSTITIKGDSDNGRINISLEKCIGCGICASNCPNDAIILQKVRNVLPPKSLIGMLRKSKKIRKSKKH
ncbi:MAG: 4Fe-4S binding protein [Promethearchaeota archaeon]